MFKRSFIVLTVLVVLLASCSRKIEQPQSKSDFLKSPELVNEDNGRGNSIKLNETKFSIKDLSRFRAVYKKDPYDKWAALGIADVLSSLEKFEEALKYYNRAEKLFTNSSPLSTDEILDWHAFLKRLKKQEQPVEKKIWRLLSQESRDTINTWKPGEKLDLRSNLRSKRIIVSGFSQIMEDRDFYNPKLFDGVKLGKECKGLLARGRKNLSINEIQRLNRLLIEHIYPCEIERSLPPRIESGTGLIEIYRNRSIINNELMDYEASLADSDRYIFMGGKDPESLYFERGVLYIGLGRKEEARKYFLKWLEYCRKVEYKLHTYDDYENVAESYLFTDDYEKALKILNKSAKLHPKSLWTFCLRGITHYEMGNYEKAKSDAEKAVKAPPEDAPVREWAIETLKKIKMKRNGKQGLTPNARKTRKNAEININAH